MFLTKVLLLLLFELLCMRCSSSGFCTQYYPCQSTCTRQSRTKTSCGWLNLRRCTEYRQRSYSCDKTCSRQVCCSGYTGSQCTTPMCFGQTSCPNGGSCIAPNNCRCTDGFAGSQCSDQNECAVGNAGCAHICTNTVGSFKCSCRSGFILSSDRKSCLDINECGKGNGGCEQKCVNEHGSFRCDCNDGYKLNQDTKTCSDTNECLADTLRCEQICSNTIGSYKCSCHPGYELALDKASCEDIDECSAGTANCGQFCNNDVGSFTCSCASGYELQPDGKICKDIDECLINDNDCVQFCIDEPGSYRCECEDGFRLNSDGRTCIDINECDEKISGCSHTCGNTIGSFVCGCEDGYILGSDETTCLDIDECEKEACHNGGSCVDGIASFTCLCRQGFTGDVCQSDIDECSFLNGGCQEFCTNNHGSFECRCRDDRLLDADGKSCIGVSTSDNVFKRYMIPRTLLPVGCFAVLLTTCKDGNDIYVYLSSTSDWNMLKSDNSVLYTYGIVFIEVNSLSLPVSLSGVEVYQHDDDFTIKTDVNVHKDSDGIPLNETRTRDCLSFDVTPQDIFDFISNDSFLKSFLSSIGVTLPDWVTFGIANTSILDIQDLKTDLVYGNKMDDISWCRGAPVLPNHMYSVFQFDSSFSLSVYDNAIELPTPLNGQKFCFIVDICHNYGGSMFLMVPKESETILTQLEIFKDLYQTQNLLIKPRGIGISFVKGVNVHYAQTDLQLWNGDHMFNYHLFDRADLWVGGGVVKQSDVFSAEGHADLFISVPRPDRILTAMFVDEWNTLVRIKFSVTPTLKFRVFGKSYRITFDDLVAGKIDVYMSIGGTQERQMCGDSSNPSGLFLSALMKINPFQNVPILQDWVVENAHIMYAFITTDSHSKLNEDTGIDVVNNLLELDDIVRQLNVFFQTTLIKFQYLVSNESRQILQVLQVAVHDFKTAIGGSVDAVPQRGLSGIIDVFTDLWKQLRTIENAFTEFLDRTEHNVDEAKDNFISMVKYHIANIKRNIHNALRKFTNQINNVVKDVSGFGLKYTTTLTLFGLKLGGIDIEFVGSTSNLMICSRFDKVRELLQGERAVRFLGRFSRERRLGYFLKVDRGFGVGGALGVDSTTVILQINAYINVIGIKTTADLFISQIGLYLYIEGNVWGLFLAQIDLSAEVGKDWHQLTINLQGRLVAKSRRRRQTQTDSSSFQDSYLDALKKATRIISNEADKRLTQAQNVLSGAQSGLSKAQGWLDKKKQDVRKANEAFDKAVESLERAKDKLEEAKEPFQRALEKLKRAQKNVDDLCRIRSCRKICIPGIRFKMCGGWIKYPCIRFTSCMFSIPNPICELANLICRGIRAIAFLALEAAKIFVRIPMLALDVAKAAVTVAQYVVDTSRVVLVLAEGVLEVAKLGIEAAKGVLELAKTSLDAIKIAIKAAARILELVIEYGLKNILDVRNCGFNIQVSTTDLPVFDVFCEVNAFKLGWKTITMRINFKNILQTIWQAAKATINAIMKGLTGLVNGRKRREISFEASSRMHLLLRHVRQSDEDPFNATVNLLNETINVINITQGFNYSVLNDFDNRVLLFEQKCTTMKTIQAFFNEIWETLFELTNETKNVLHEASEIFDLLENYDIEKLTQNMTLENANISIDHALTDYNLTNADLEKALEETKASVLKDPMMQELSSVADVSRAMLTSELESVEQSALLNNWVLAMENRTKAYFNESECVDFLDCVLYAVSELFDIYTGEDHPNISEINHAITDLEDNLLNIIQNTSQSIVNIYNSSVSISSNLKVLDDLNLFCSEPPRFLFKLQNITVIRGHTVSMKCHVVAKPSPSYWWFKDNQLLTDEDESALVIVNATEEDEAVYQCMAGNVVANITSNEAYLYIAENHEDDPASQHISEPVSNSVICYVVLLILLGVNTVLVTTEVYLIGTRNKYFVSRGESMFMLRKVILPALVLCGLAIIIQIVFYFVAKPNCKVIGGLVVPILGMILTEGISVGIIAACKHFKGLPVEHSGEECVSSGGHCSQNTKVEHRGEECASSGGQCSLNTKGQLSNPSNLRFDRDMSILPWEASKDVGMPRHETIPHVLKVAEFNRKEINPQKCPDSTEVGKSCISLIEGTTNWKAVSAATEPNTGFESPNLTPGKEHDFRLGVESKYGIHAEINATKQDNTFSGRNNANRYSRHLSIQPLCKNERKADDCHESQEKQRGLGQNSGGKAGNRAQVSRKPQP